MRTNSITVNYKNKAFTLDRVNADGKCFQIGFECLNWGIRIYRLENEQMQIVIEKSVKKSDGSSSTQFLWNCYCTLIEYKLFLIDVNDPATCKRISRRTKWFLIEPMIKEIHVQLKDELI